MAQWIRRPPPKGKITGSTPVRDTLGPIAALAQSVERQSHEKI